MRKEARIAEILARIRDIPPGHVRAYSDIDPHAPRQVGRILATTNEAVPWHRVVHADGTIPKGKRQQELLLREGVPMRGDRVDIERARA
jgi:methylated-DNA-protein-cysteine methyltransferase related protein